MLARVGRQLRASTTLASTGVGGAASLRVMSACVLADCTIQRHPESFASSSLFALRRESWPDYDAHGYDPDLCYGGPEHDIHTDPLGWRRRTRAVATVVADYKPQLLALTDCQANQCDELVALLNRQAGGGATFALSKLCPFYGGDEAVNLCLAVVYDTSALELLSQAAVAMDDQNTLRCLFRTLADGDDLDVVLHYNPPRTVIEDVVERRGELHWSRLVEHLRLDPPARRYLLTGNFSRPTRGDSGDYIGQGIRRLGLSDAFPGHQAPPTYAPPYLGKAPVRWDYVLASRALEMTAARMLPAIREIRTASGELDGAAMRDALLLATGCSHAPIGVELLLR